MPTGEVLIVGLTQMSKGLCVGAVDMTNRQSLRLLQRERYEQWQPKDGWRIGHVFQIEYERLTPCDPPHVEDVFVLSRTWLKGRRADVRIAAGMIAHWRGRIDECFDGCLNWSSSGAGFVSRQRISSCSTGFWRPSLALRRDKFDCYWADGTAWNRAGPKRKLKYVGVGPAPEVIPANALVRLSLSRWWSPDGAAAEGCWLQLSGVLDA
jgi:hypothetical protein